jgi:hypothetical protein
MSSRLSESLSSWERRFYSIISIILRAASPGFNSTSARKSLSTRNRIACDKFETVTRISGKRSLKGDESPQGKKDILNDSHSARDLAGKQMDYEVVSSAVGGISFEAV